MIPQNKEIKCNFMYVLEVKIQILEEKKKKEKNKQRYRVKVSKFLEDYNLF